MKVAFRVNIGKDIGLGHAKRCLSLAKELKKQNIECSFFFNTTNKYIQDNFSEFKHFTLYTEDQSINFPDNQKEDAEAFLKKVEVEGLNFDWVILDSYLLRFQWESTIKEAGYSLLVVDDLNQDKHLCDILVDQKFESDQTEKRYQDLLPENCVRLLGPQFALLANEYTQGNEAEPRGKSKTLKVLFGIGGGGDFSLYKDFLIELSQQTDISLSIIVGPFAKHSEYLDNLENENVKIFKNLPTLKDLYLSHDLFIGALGTSLYELAATKLPAITFSIAENQTNNLRDLEAYGHYFHFNYLALSELSKLIPIIHSFKDNYARIENLRLKSKLKFDHLGCQRIAECLLAKENKYPLSDFWDANASMDEALITNGDFEIYLANDSRINHYRESRNLPKNSQNMSIQSEISQLEHYGWWFNNSRKSYLLKKSNVEVLYIWDQLKEHNNHQYLIGGWFVCREDTGFDAAMFALNWQLSHCKVDNPYAKWVAVIKKDNEFVNMLNKYLGFTTIEPGCNDFEATQLYFPEASPEAFNFVMK